MDSGLCTPEAPPDPEVGPAILANAAHLAAPQSGPPRPLAAAAAATVNGV
jgi:hypothetical protein